MRPVYVTGHRNPDTDSIASAIGHAELRRRPDPKTEYVPVRLGEPNAQTRWVLEGAGVPAPRHLPPIMLRVRDVMEQEFDRAHVDESVRSGGPTLARRRPGCSSGRTPRRGAACRASCCASATS